jgi:hypothetical protein
MYRYELLSDVAELDSNEPDCSSDRAHLHHNTPKFYYQQQGQMFKAAITAAPVATLRLAAERVSQLLGATGAPPRSCDR